MDKRVLVAVVLSLLVLVLFDPFFAPPKKQQPLNKSGETVETPMPEKKVGEVLEEKKMESYPSAPQSVSMPEKEVKVETPLYSAVFSSHGRHVKALVFKKIF